jgi:hypothetical protein
MRHGLPLNKLKVAAGALRARMTAAGRTLARRAHASAGRVWRDVGELLQLEPAGPDAAGAYPPHQGEATNTERNRALGPRTGAIVEAMAEVLARSGYHEIRADLPDFPRPDLVRGTVRSHRPSLAAVGGGRPVLLDVYIPEESPLEEHQSRWHLFASAADRDRGELHVVVPAWLEGTAGRAWMRGIAEVAGLTICKVWEV